jgi:hypothetical protein
MAEKSHEVSQNSPRLFRDAKRVPLEHNKKDYSLVKFLHAFINGRNNIPDMSTADTEEHLLSCMRQGHIMKYL